MSLNGLNEKSKTENSSKEVTSSQNQNVPINRWTIKNILEWLNRKMPDIYEMHRNSFINNQITGETLLDFNEDCLDYLEIYDFKLRLELQKYSKYS